MITHSEATLIRINAGDIVIPPSPFILTLPNQHILLTTERMTHECGDRFKNKNEERHQVPQRYGFSDQ
jgi:hypothetical protein